MIVCTWAINISIHPIRIFSGDSDMEVVGKVTRKVVGFFLNRIVSLW